MDHNNSPFHDRDFDNGNSTNGIDETLEPINNDNELLLSNPIQIVLKTYSKPISKTNVNINYEFILYYKYDKWTINITLNQIKEYLKSLKLLSFEYIPGENILNHHNDKSITPLNNNITSLMKYFIYRYDILLSPLSYNFFHFDQCPSLTQLKCHIANESLHLLYKFTIENSDQDASDLIYDSDSGLLLLAYEDVSLLSSIGRFWSLIDAEVLGSLRIYQRVFDDKQKPYFTRAITKGFDVRLSKIDISNSINKILVGFDNGTVHTFNINYLQSSFPQLNQSISTNKIVITEGIKFKHLTDRITGFGFMNNYVFIASKENKIIIISFSLNHPSSMPEIVFNASIKKRIEGKGYIDNIKVNHSSLKLYMISSSKVILIYDIIKEEEKMRIDFWKEIVCVDTIQNIFFKAGSLFVASKNKIQFVKLETIENKKDCNKDDDYVLSFDGSVDNKSSYSLQYFIIDFTNQIKAICYFGLKQLFILGLSNGTVVLLSAKSIEVVFAKKVSQHSIMSLILLEEETCMLIAGDKKGSTFFYRFGSE